MVGGCLHCQEGKQEAVSKDGRMEKMLKKGCCRGGGGWQMTPY